MRPRTDTHSTAITKTLKSIGKFNGADAPMRADRGRESDGSAAPVMEMLKQTGMVVVLVLLSEGLFVLSGGSTLGRGRPPSAGSSITAEFVAGAILCSSALMLLYSLGTRDEK
jgi:hypothetical protein